MNVVASLCFVIPAALIYKKKKTISFAIIGLAAGVLCMTASMVLWNWLISPLYMGVPREVIVPMLPTVFAPFNLIKAGINMGLTLIIYKPISAILHKSGILEERNAKEETVVKESSDKHKFSPMAIIVGLVIVAVCIGAIVLIKLTA